VQLFKKSQLFAIIYVFYNEKIHFTDKNIEWMTIACALQGKRRMM